jgi:hypothetical protein
VTAGPAAEGLAKSLPHQITPSAARCLPAGESGKSADMLNPFQLLDPWLMLGGVALLMLTVFVWNSPRRKGDGVAKVGRSDAAVGRRGRVGKSPKRELPVS